MSSEMPRQLRKKLRELEVEHAKVFAKLAAISHDRTLPGTYLCMESGPYAGLLSASLVREVVSLVPFSPLPGAPAFVLGQFFYRGEPITAVSLGGYLGAAREPDVDDHVLVLSSALRLALVVDRVRNLVESPTLLGGGEALEDHAWGRSQLVQGVCRVASDLLPLIGVEPLIAQLTQVAR